MRHDILRIAAIAVGAGILAFGVRTLTVAQVFQAGVPILPPYDDLYHWKRIAFSAANFPAVLEFDPDRGLRGAFTPWPPLYDLAAAAIARLAGATGAIDVLRVIVWIPPITASLLTAATVAIIGRFAPLAAALAAVPLACGPFLVVSSWIGTIDHHFLEPFLALAILGGTVLVLRAEGRDSTIAAVILAGAIATALLIQTALIFAAGLSFICIFLVARRSQAIGAGAVALATAAVPIVVYRLTRPEGFPDGPWFLGDVHAALLVGAATALAIALLLDRRGGRSPIAALLAFTAGLLVVAAQSDAAASLASGFTFFSGDPWLKAIDEFQPVWRPLSSLPHHVAALALGALASVVLMVDSLRRGLTADFVIAVFTMAYIAATLPSQRFAVISTALAAVATAVLIERLRLRGMALIVMAVLLVAIPPLQLLSWWRSGVPLGLSGQAINFLRAANFLREKGEAGRVLAPWAYGHLFNVIGERAVVLDNFGSMSDPETFRRAHEILLSTDERNVAQFADRFGIRYIVLESPLYGIVKYVRFLGFPEESFFRERKLTAHSQATWYWRAYFRPDTLRAFRRIAGDDVVLILERVSAEGGRPVASDTIRAR